MPWSNNNGGWKGGGGGPWGSGPQQGGPNPPDLEDILKKSQDRLKTVIPGGGGSLGLKGLLVLIAVLLVIWGATGIYRVQPDEQGIVLRFGKFVNKTSPGLHFHLPYPIETVEKPKVTRINQITVGIQQSDNLRNPNLAGRDIPEESLMLTGDENIVDVDFSVFWVIADAEKYLFNIQNPEATVKAVAESAMREVVGRSDIQPILTQARQVTEADVLDLMQKTLDDYGAGIRVTEVQLQKVDPPSQVIDAFRDVQAARADQERARNEAQAYANRIIPEARGEAERIRQASEAYREQTIAEAQGQADRFISVFNEYKKAPGVTRERMYLETMERVFGDSEKIVIDSKIGGQGVVPYLPLNELTRNNGGGAKQ
ncbi:MAG: FtsH protease activity modulator HflK [Rhodobiaceae bacterium]|nr:FtsH protease activity modulator HflK [Rhodobiaceae bacterium]